MVQVFLKSIGRSFGLLLFRPQRGALERPAIPVRPGKPDHLEQAPLGQPVILAHLELVRPARLATSAQQAQQGIRATLSPVQQDQLDLPEPVRRAM